MDKDNLQDKNIHKKCDVCGQDILIDKLGFGGCLNCGWQNSDAALERPDYPNLDNFVSLNNAKKLYREGKPIKPSFDEFMEFVRVYGEVQFRYKNNVYGIIRGDKISMFCVGVNDSAKVYPSYEDFENRADIDGLLLKGIWDLVEAVDYLQ